MIAYLQGGMGNQMFQYAMARAEAIRLGAELKLNINSFDKDSMRRYSLGLWKGVMAPEVSETAEIVQEQGLPYNPEVLQKVTKDSMLVGYWQCEKYFHLIRYLLLDEFVPKQPLTIRGQETLKHILRARERSVFLTIRRTDYTKTDFHGVLPLDYYRKALAIVAKFIDPIVFVFSDEPEWCEQNLRFPYTTFIAGNYDRTTKEHLGREDEELWLMRHCHHAIMANSSYSWWGAWLGADRSGGLVIAPNQWFYKASEDPRDICPDRWLKI